jgi:hypothetical protein
MDKREIWEAVDSEMKTQKGKYWPQHVVSQAAKVADNATAMLGNALVLKYGTPEQKEDKTRLIRDVYLRQNAIKTIVAAMLYLENENVEEPNPHHVDK